MYDFLEEKLNLAKEILDKSGLQYVAGNIQNISGWNMIGSSPKDIVNLPIGVLRALNSYEGSKLLEEEKSRSLLTVLYQRHISCFDKSWNRYQCLLWNDFYESAEEDNIGTEFRKVFCKLGTISKDAEYALYKQYLFHRSLLEQHVKLPLVPSNKQYKEMLEKARYILECVEHETAINRMFLKQAMKQARFYQYEDKKYEIHMLKSLNDFLKESEYQKNCLWSFVELACTGYVTILALREKGKKEVPFVTIEVRGNPMECPELLQVKGRFNKEVGDEVKEWILAYCEEHCIETFGCDDLYETIFEVM